MTCPYGECEAKAICLYNRRCERRVRAFEARALDEAAKSRQFWGRIAMSRTRGWRR